MTGTFAYVFIGRNDPMKPLSDGGFDHSNVIHILDQKGEIVFQQNGLGANPEQSVQEIRSLLKSL